MISDTIPAVVVFDLIIIGSILLTVGLAGSFGVFKKGSVPRTGRLLLILGLAFAGLYCLCDLVLLYMGATSPLESSGGLTFAQVLDALHWIAPLISLLLITTGFTVIAHQRRILEQRLAQSEAIAGCAEETAAKSDARIGGILEQSTDGIYCFEFRPPISIDLPIEDQVARSFDAVLVECNMAFAKSIGKSSRREAIGSRFGDMSSIMTPESHALFHKKLVEEGFRLVDYRFSFLDPEGKRHLLLISATGEIEDGALVRLWGTDKNILDESEVRETLVGRLKFHEFLARVSSRLLLAEPESVEDSLVSSLKDIANHMCVDRMTVVWLDKETGTINPRYFWNKAGGRPWDQISLDEFPFLGQRLTRGVPVVVDSLEDVAKDSVRDARGLAKIGIKSVCAVPLVVAGTIYGFCTMGVVKEERSWNQYELADLQTFADLIANVVFRINASKALNQAMSELQEMKERLEAENVYLQQEISLNNGFDELIGQSAKLKHCLQQVQQVAGTDTAVLVQGETGTGKELIVRAIHKISDRSDRPLVKVNCAALPAELIESELFGHEKGAFTGASSHKRGRFDLANGGTLFLDEIGDFPLELQGKLLRALQEGEFQRVGGTDTLHVDVRLIAATNRNLEISVDSGLFRADLYYRISVYPIDLPPLREREGDIQLLAEHFVHKHAARLGKNINAISASMMSQLLAYPWPGNVRELESVVLRALISAVGPVLKLAETLGGGRAAASVDQHGQIPVPVDLFGAEKAHIVRVLDQAGWVVGGGSGAAEKLGVPASTLRSKMKKLGISRPS